jgi:hypothetical protein
VGLLKTSRALKLTKLKTEKLPLVQTKKKKKKKIMSVPENLKERC